VLGDEDKRIVEGMEEEGEAFTAAVGELYPKAHTKTLLDEDGVVVTHIRLLALLRGEGKPMARRKRLDLTILTMIQRSADSDGRFHTR